MSDDEYSEQWQERLERVPPSILADDIDADSLAGRYLIRDLRQIDELCREAGRQARPDELVRIEHFDKAASVLDITTVEDVDAIEADGGMASAERVDELDERVEELEHQVGELGHEINHVNSKVNRILKAARSFTDHLRGAGGERDV